MTSKAASGRERDYERACGQSCARLAASGKGSSVGGTKLVAPTKDVPTDADRGIGKRQSAQAAMPRATMYAQQAYALGDAGFGPREAFRRHSFGMAKDAVKTRTRRGSP
jgi:hypothetical protein